MITYLLDFHDDWSECEKSKSYLELMHKAHVGVDAEPSLLDVAECIPIEYMLEHYNHSTERYCKLFKRKQILITFSLVLSFQLQQMWIYLCFYTFTFYILPIMQQYVS